MLCDNIALNNFDGIVRRKANMDMKAKVFGQKLQDKEYHDREAAYLVLVDGDLFALVKTCSGKLFLPGGKIETGESKEECIIRECMEELGVKVVVKDCFACGERYFYHEASNRYSHAIGHFYFSDEFEKVSEPLEKGNEVLWRPYKETVTDMFHPHHVWAVELIKERMEKESSARQHG